MKRASKVLLTLITLYFLGYASKEKNKKCPFYGIWQNGEATLRISNFGFILLKTKRKTYTASIHDYEKQRELPAMLAIEKGECYHVSLQHNVTLGTQAIIVVCDDQLFWKSDTMNFFMEFSR